MVFWRDERVACVYGANIEERDCFVVLVYFVRGDLSADDFAENTLLHALSIAHAAICSKTRSFCFKC